MPYSYAQYAGNGALTSFSVPFPYLLRAHVNLYLGLVIETGAYESALTEGVDYSWASATQIQVFVPPAAGKTLTVRRQTPNGSLVVQWGDGSNLIASDLNTSDLQNLYVVQEWVDYATRSNEVSQSAIAQALAAVATANAALPKAGGTMTGPIALSGDPTAPSHAVSRQYAESQFGTIIQPATPAGAAWPVGKTWLQNDPNKTLSFWDGLTWLGVASGGTFTLQPTVIYVDSVNGSDTNDGHRIINPKKTIKNAVASANAGDIIKVAPGVYQETLPIDITVDNLSIVGDSQRSCFVNPTVATETQIMFRCNSGTYIDGFTFVGLKASGARGGHAIDNDATYGLPASQGWVAGFYPGCIIKKSPYINNCSNFADSAIDNSAFNPNNYQGTGGDVSSGPTGGGIIVDGSLPAVSSPLRSFVINEFTQVCLDGPGLLVCNNGYAQAVSFFGLFCHYHAKALSGGQINMEVGTTDFGRYGLIADGKSSSAIFTATANGGASAGATAFAINAPSAGGSWFGDANRPAINMLVQIGSDIYPILSATANGGGWNVVISRPNPANRAINLGLINSHANGAAVSFFLRSMISTASHTMEYAGSGTNYNALPENGGVPVEANEAVNRNNGKVWLTSTDQSGKFKVGDTFQVDQQTGFVTIDPNSYSPNIVQDLSPELGGNLDVLTRNIYSSVGNVQINDTLDVTGALNVTGNARLGTKNSNSAEFYFGGNWSAGDYFSIAWNNQYQTSTEIRGIQVDVPGSSRESALAFFTTNNSNVKNEQARIDGFGRLLVGTTGVPGSLNSLAAIDQAGTYDCGLLINSSGGTKIPTLWLRDASATKAGLIVGQAGLKLGTNNSGTTALTIDTSQRVLVGTTSTTANGGVLQVSNGITFPATQSACSDANTLDDYEEGTWTPTFVSTSATFSYNYQTGKYTKIGNTVHIYAYIQASATGTLTNAIFISSLPFTPSNGATDYNAISFLANSGANNIAGMVTPSNQIEIYSAPGTAATPSFLGMPSSKWVTIGGSYRV